MIELTIQEQISVLKNLDTEEILKHGLCAAISKELNKSYSEFYISFKSLSLIIPIFQYENALQFNARTDITPHYSAYCFWWKLNEKDNFENRMKFVQWMIDELEKQL